jgi:hypothetical protein
MFTEFTQEGFTAFEEVSNEVRNAIADDLTALRKLYKKAPADDRIRSALMRFTSISTAFSNGMKIHCDQIRKIKDYDSNHVIADLGYFGQLAREYLSYFTELIRLFLGYWDIQEIENKPAYLQRAIETLSYITALTSQGLQFNLSSIVPATYFFRTQTNAHVMLTPTEIKYTTEHPKITSTHNQSYLMERWDWLLPDIDGLSFPREQTFWNGDGKLNDHLYQLAANHKENMSVKWPAVKQNYWSPGEKILSSRPLSPEDIGFQPIPSIVPYYDKKMDALSATIMPTLVDLKFKIDNGQFRYGRFLYLNPLSVGASQVGLSFPSTEASQFTDASIGLFWETKENAQYVSKLRSTIHKFSLGRNETTIWEGITNIGRLNFMFPE